MSRVMELDLTGHRPYFIVAGITLLLLGLGWLGHASLPSGDQFLTRSEWQFLKADLAYRKELSHLQGTLEILANLLNERPDPVRAQLVAESIQRQASQGQPALAYQREKLVLAAQAVSDWAVGAIEHEAARQALQEAIQSLYPEQAGLTLPNTSRIPAPEAKRR
jgi:hypothetical protein